MGGACPQGETPPLDASNLESKITLGDGGVTSAVETPPSEYTGIPPTKSGNDTYITTLPATPKGAPGISRNPSDRVYDDIERTGVEADDEDETDAMTYVNSSGDDYSSTGTNGDGSEGGGGTAEFNSSDEDGGMGEVNSSDEEGAGGAGGAAFGGGGGGVPPIRVESRNAVPQAIVDPRSPEKSAGWMNSRMTKSFRARMTKSRYLTRSELEIVLKRGKEGLEEEYELIPHNNANFEDLPKLTEWKNRYANILPNKHSRVKLTLSKEDAKEEKESPGITPGDSPSSYINANWLNGYSDVTKAYIACQGPLQETIHDFWRMVWESNSHTLVMNTNLIEGENTVVKCERYWPETIEEPMNIESVDGFKPFTVTATRIETPQSQYMQTLLEVEYDGGTRHITHLWWRGWPDKGVPKTPNGIGHYIKAARASRDDSGGPIVIHCSAGVGRTGCFLAIDMCMQEFDSLNRIDILGCVCRMRQARGFTVQTASQYHFIHIAMQRYMEGTLFTDLALPQKQTRRRRSVEEMLTLKDHKEKRKQSKRKRSKRMHMRRAQRNPHHASLAAIGPKPVWPPRGPTPKTPSPVKKPPNSVDGVGDVIDDTAVIGEHEVTCPESIASLGKTGSGMSLTSEIPEVETISED